MINYRVENLVALIEELKENGAKALLQHPSDIFTLLT